MPACQRISLNLKKIFPTTRLWKEFWWETLLVKSITDTNINNENIQHPPRSYKWCTLKQVMRTDRKRWRDLTDSTLNIINIQLRNKMTIIFIFLHDMRGSLLFHYTFFKTPNASIFGPVKPPIFHINIFTLMVIGLNLGGFWQSFTLFLVL